MSDRQKAIILLVLLILIPVLLTDPLDWPQRIEAPPPAPPASPSVKSPPAKQGHGFQSWEDPGFDREAFLISFKRQSALALRDCLIASNLSERAFSASATLNRRGEISHLRWNNDEPIPECVVAAIRAMNFSRQSENLKRPAIEIQWRVDW